MCGIVGLVHLSGDSPGRGTLERMCDTLRHRGPDDRATDVRAGVGLGMTRLAVIDVEGGAQPYRSEDGAVTAVFNGEIYNFAELRSRLRARGHVFRGHSDGEVVVHLWEELGPAALDELEGMFALAVHDGARRRLHLARDRIGVKPLFVAVERERLVFASEIKAILAAGGVDRAPDDRALDEFLTWEYVPAPRTMFAAVEKLEAGGLLSVDLATGGVERRRWWRLDASRAADLARARGRADETLADEIDAVLGRSVRAQLVSDVPLGAFLSGGVDSSLVTAHMGSASTFSIGFDDPTYDELPWAERVATHLGTEHHRAVLATSARDLPDRLLHYMEDPIADVSIFPTYLVSRLARERVTVALSGDGGDELFGGYETYLAQRLARPFDGLPGPARRLPRTLISSFPPAAAKKGYWNRAQRFAEGLALPPELEHARWRMFVPPGLRSRLYADEWRRELPANAGEHIRRAFREAAPLPPLGRRLYVDLRSYLVDNCLVKVDRMSMACSLEVRVPFLAESVVESAFGLPDRAKLRGVTTKPLLKRVAARHVPAECVYRPKEGFSMPMKHWLRDELRPRLEDLLSADRLRREGRFDSATVEELKREHLEGRANHSHLLWALLVYQDWRDRWAA